jgi:cell division protein ZapA
MAIVNVEVNGRSHQVGCEDGQEAHVMALGRQFDGLVRQVAAEVGQVGDVRLLLLAALTQADEMSETNKRLSETQAALARLTTDYRALERRAALALDDAARRVEAIGVRAG